MRKMILFVMVVVLALAMLAPAAGPAAAGQSGPGSRSNPVVVGYSTPDLTVQWGAWLKFRNGWAFADDPEYVELVVNGGYDVQTFVDGIERPTKITVEDVGVVCDAPSPAPPVCHDATAVWWNYLTKLQPGVHEWTSRATCLVELPDDGFGYGPCLAGTVIEFSGTVTVLGK